MRRLLEGIKKRAGWNKGGEEKTLKPSPIITHLKRLSSAAPNIANLYYRKKGLALQSGKTLFLIGKNLITILHMELNRVVSKGYVDFVVIKSF